MAFHVCARCGVATYRQSLSTSFRRTQPITASWNVPSRPSQSSPPRLLGAVGLLAVVGGDHEDDSLHVINLVEESPFTHAIAPSGGLPVLEAIDVRAEIGVLAQEGVDVVAELGFDSLLYGRSETREILRKLAGLEDSIGR